MTYCFLYRFLLEGIFDLTLERGPTVADGHVDFVSRNIGIPFESIDHSIGKVNVSPFGRFGQTHFDIIDYGLHTMNAVSGLLGGLLFRIRIDPAAQRDNSILDKEISGTIIDHDRPRQILIVPATTTKGNGLDPHFRCRLNIIGGIETSV